MMKKTVKKKLRKNHKKIRRKMMKAKIANMKIITKMWTKITLESIFQKKPVGFRATIARAKFKKKRASTSQKSHNQSHLLLKRPKSYKSLKRSRYNLPLTRANNRRSNKRTTQPYRTIPYPTQRSWTRSYLATKWTRATWATPVSRTAMTIRTANLKRATKIT